MYDIDFIDRFSVMGVTAVFQLSGRTSAYFGYDIYLSFFPLMIGITLCMKSDKYFNKG